MSTLIPRRTRFAPLGRLAPWSDIEGLQDRLDRFMGQMMTNPFPDDASTWAPAIDFEEKESEFVMTAEFPGMTEKDITVDVEQNTLTLKGEKKSEREEKEKGRWHLVERSWGSFERSFALPSTVDAAKVKAGFENGLLTVHLPKRETSAGRRVPIGKGG